MRVELFKVYFKSKAKRLIIIIAGFLAALLSLLAMVIKTINNEWVLDQFPGDWFIPVLLIIGLSYGVQGILDFNKSRQPFIEVRDDEILLKKLHKSPIQRFDVEELKEIKIGYIDITFIFKTGEVTTFDVSYARYDQIRELKSILESIKEKHNI